MSCPIRIAPSVLAADFGHLKEEIDAVDRHGADWLHLDVMDGHFVPNISFGIPVVRSIREATDLFLDVHLMISEPERYAERFIEAGADLVSFHIEACPEPGEVIETIHEKGARAGLALNPDTPFDTVAPHLENLDLVLAMTVFPGFGGQSFMETVMPKVTRLREAVGDACDIEVDGGIKAETAKVAGQAGANVFVAGTAIFKAPDIEAAIRGIRSGAKQGQNG